MRIIRDLSVFFNAECLAYNLHSKFYKIMIQGLALTILSACMVTATSIDHAARTLSRGQYETICNNNNEK
jgi:3-oxoacyl-(acyl-carrier-protein) synthase